jgi:cell division protein FtsW
LGTPVVIGATVLIMLFVGGVPLRHLLLVGACSIPPLVALVWLYPYRLRRLIVFLNPDADPLNTGFQIRQSLIAIGSGNINGLGLGMSVQKMHYLPEAHTDFAFAIIGEELGFVGAAITILLFLLFFYIVYRLTMQIQDLFGHLVAVGIMSILALQTVINIGVVTGCLPTKGLALPFISYGGSSLVMTLAACGLLLNIVYNQRYLRVETGVARGYDETIV